MAIERSPSKERQSRLRLICLSLVAATVAGNLCYLVRVHRGQWLRRPPTSDLFGACLVNPHNHQELQPALYLRAYLRGKTLLTARPEHHDSAFLMHSQIRQRAFDDGIAQQEFVALLKRSFLVLDGKHFFILDDIQTHSEIVHLTFQQFHIYVPKALQERL